MQERRSVCGGGGGIVVYGNVVSVMASVKCWPHSGYLEELLASIGV